MGCQHTSTAHVLQLQQKLQRNCLSQPVDLTGCVHTLPAAVSQDINTVPLDMPSHTMLRSLQFSLASVVVPEGMFA